MTDVTVPAVNSLPVVVSAVPDVPKLPKVLFTIAEVAVMFGMSEDRVRRLVHRGKLRARNTGGEHRNQGSYQIPITAIQEYLAGSDEPLASAS